MILEEPSHPATLPLKSGGERAFPNPRHRRCLDPLRRRAGAQQGDPGDLAAPNHRRNRTERLGQSTLFNVVTGVTRADAGSVRFMGGHHRLGSHEINQLGIGRTFQLTRLFGRMTAFENLVVVARGTSRGAVTGRGIARCRRAARRSGRIRRQPLLRPAEAPGVRPPADDRPDLVMLDEPFAGVNPTMERRLLEQMDGWVRDGKTIVVTDHEMKIMMEICEEIFVLNYGESSPTALLARFGRTHASWTPTLAAEAASDAKADVALAPASRRCSRCTRSTPPTARCASSTVSHSRCGRGKSSQLSAQTAPASRPC